MTTFDQDGTQRAAARDMHRMMAVIVNEEAYQMLLAISQDLSDYATQLPTGEWSVNLQVRNVVVMDAACLPGETMSDMIIRCGPRVVARIKREERRVHR